MADPLNLPLKFPFTSAAGTYLASLPIKRLKRKDLTAAHSYSPKDEGAQEDFLFAKMTGLTIEDLGDLDVSDSKTLSAVFREMVDGGDIAAVLGRGDVTDSENAAVGDSPAVDG
ncbi:phage tail assembly protein [Pseudomonas sp. HMWF006]|uniref:phage tail assembly protein n=1 Tax=Pseudomonas sp. HMWF006 TaxID=2056843 RepID=UPI000D4BF5A6|nr:phage tail assembly protein [Pseudomonas sp. HMWF006]PTT02211.1 phage tail assembly protein [Pseudomonas sp. HMWF006]PTT94654.1 phage tail assembly protein [Pseudomonas sp. HMWF005]